MRCTASRGERLSFMGVTTLGVAPPLEVAPLLEVPPLEVELPSEVLPLVRSLGLLVAQDWEVGIGDGV